MAKGIEWGLLAACVLGLVGGLFGGLGMAQDRAEADWEKLYERGEYRNPEGAVLKYRLLRPENVEPGQRYPLVVFLHGAGERGGDNRLQLVHGMREFARADRRKEFPAFVLAPQCPSNQKWVDVPWDAPKHEQPDRPAEAMALCLKLIDQLNKESPIDDGRIYLTGLSMGGFGTFDAIARWPDRFAAAIPICGGGDARKDTVSRYRDLPLWIFHGGKDTVVRPERSREIVAALKEIGAEPRYTEYPDAGHDSWTQTYADEAVFRWLFSQQRGTQSGGGK